MMNTNEAIEEREGSLRKIFKKTSLVDIFSHYMGRDYNIPTYSRGTKCIDFILASNNLLPYVTNVLLLLGSHGGIGTGGLGCIYR
jgi:hypothetical protein